MSFFRQFPKTTYDFQNIGYDTNITDIFRFAQADFQVTDDVASYEYYQIKDGDRPDVVSQLLYDTPDYYWTFFLCNEHLKNGTTQWPLSSIQFEQYMEEEYSGTCIITRPTIVRNTDGIITDYRDSLAGRFRIGETVVGGTSGATGTIFKKDTQLSQLIVRNVTGTFIGNNTYPLTQSEIITQTTGPAGDPSIGSQVSTWKCVPWAEAPHHYVKADGTWSYDALYINEQVIDGQGQTIIDNPAGVNDSELTMVTNREYEMEQNDIRSNIRVVRPKMIYAWAQQYKKLINA